MFWNVYIGRKLVDTVWYVKSCDQEYVSSSLINHDGYDSRIRVVKAR